MRMRLSFSSASPAMAEPLMHTEDRRPSTSAVLPDGFTPPLAYSPNYYAALDEGDPTRTFREGTKFQDALGQPSMRSMYSYGISTRLHQEWGDCTEPCGSSKDFTFSHAGYKDICEDNEGFTSIQESSEDAANTHDGGQDSLEELMDPYFQELEACSSECSSAISMVTNVESDSTSRLDKAETPVDCIESQWTDAKHGSYLDYMETNFVKNLYGREYCALDVCGQVPFHQVEMSFSPLPSTPFELKSWQSGDWYRRSVPKPLLGTCIPLALLKSPWVNHFRCHISPHIKYQINMENASSSCSIDEGEEVNSQPTELCREARGHLHPLKFELGLEENFLCKTGSRVDDAVKVWKQNGLQQFARDTQKLSFPIVKKRAFETDIAQEPSIRCKREKKSSE